MGSIAPPRPIRLQVSAALTERIIQQGGCAGPAGDDDPVLLANVNNVFIVNDKSRLLGVVFFWKL